MKKANSRSHVVIQLKKKSFVDEKAFYKTVDATRLVTALEQKKQRRMYKNTYLMSVLHDV